MAALNLQSFNEPNKGTFTLNAAIPGEVMRRSAVVLAFIFVGVLAWYVSLLWVNNYTSQPISKKQLTVHLEKAISWIEENIDSVEKASNPPLWWMLKQSAEISENPRLVSFYKRHEDELLNMRGMYMWANMFDPDASVELPDLYLLQYLPNYNYLFLYGLTCDPDWGSEPEVQKQLDLEFCSMHFLHPRCVSHQMVGIRFMQRSNCGDSKEVEKLIRGLQDIIVAELTWDPRVVDAYIQRVVMLVDSGAVSRVNPTWIQHILNAQNVDGGWGDIDPVLHLPGGKALGFTSKKIGYGKISSNFHATAQGIWLISLLLSQ